MPPRVTRGVFITVEGGDGAGKTTQTSLLVEWLTHHGYHPLATREPGGSALGEKLRATLVEEPGILPLTELLLFQALRAQHVHDVIRPALRRGRLVVCDRYADSTMAYQGYGLGLNRRLIQMMTGWVTDGAEPDLTIMLDAPAAAGLRRSLRRQQMEQRGVAFQRRVRRGFLAIARREPRRCRVIRVHATPAATQRLIQQVVRDALQRRHRA